MASLLVLIVTGLLLSVRDVGEFAAKDGEKVGLLGNRLLLVPPPDQLRAGRDL